LEQNNTETFVEWFRNSSPYINAFRGRTFVICFAGEMVADAGFAHLIHDIALLNSLGVKLVLVHGARPQIEQRLNQSGIQLNYVDGIRITDLPALQCVTEAVGSVRVQIEAQLSMGLANSPMAGARLRVSSGNFVTAQPLGVHNGTDFQHTGEVRRVDTEAVNEQLALNNIVLLPPLGYSATGEVFNINAEEVAEKAAIALKAEKLIYLGHCQSLLDILHGDRELTLQQIEQLKDLPEDINRTLKHVAWAVSKGVPRCHLIEQSLDGGLLLELFTRDGCGVLITAEQFEGMC
jgi:amino-acid N-acetyltransferase